MNTGTLHTQAYICVHSDYTNFKVVHSTTMTKFSLNFESIFQKCLAPHQPISTPSIHVRKARRS